MQQDNVVKTEYIMETVLFTFCNILTIQTTAHKIAVENFKAVTKQRTRSNFKKNTIGDGGSTAL